MYICPMYSKELLKGTLNTIILKLLDRNGRMYGYEITQRVKLLSTDKILLTEGALYPSLHKLESQGLVKAEKEMIGKRLRKYYSLTPKGQKAVSEKVSEFQEFIQTMEVVLNLKKGKETWQI